MVGGFARASRLRVEELLPEAGAVAAIAEAEAEIIGHVNEDHPEAVAAIACGLLGGETGKWRLAAVDVDGLDLALGETVLRLAFERSAATPEDVRSELIRAARSGRLRDGASQ